MFATYLTMLTPMSFAGGPTPKELFGLPGATTESAALLTITFTFGMASLAIKYERGRSQVASWLLVTLALGLVFLGLETREFAGMLAEGAAPQQSGFLSAAREAAASCSRMPYPSYLESPKKMHIYGA